MKVTRSKHIILIMGCLQLLNSNKIVNDLIRRLISAAWVPSIKMELQSGTSRRPHHGLEQTCYTLHTIGRSMHLSNSGQWLSTMRCGCSIIYLELTLDCVLMKCGRKLGPHMMIYAEPMFGGVRFMCLSRNYRMESKFQNGNLELVLACSLAFHWCILLWCR